MTYLHSMTAYTEGIRALQPARWLGLDGMMNVFWDAEGETGATGYYLSPDPRIVVFFNNVAPHIEMSNRENGRDEYFRPMTRAVYVPAGVPLWTRFTSPHRFSHLDVHLHRDRVLKFLTPSLGSSMAQAALRSPVELQDVGAVNTLAGLLVSEVSAPSRHPLFAESLVGSIISGLLDIHDDGGDQSVGRITQAQMNRLVSTVNSRGDFRMTVGEMAETVGLSESWFANVFKQTTGKTPMQWLLQRRIELVQKLLMESNLPVAAIAAQLGFSDQAHLTKTFRQITGETPAAWRKIQLNRM